MPDPYREPMPQPTPPRDVMRIVLIIAGSMAGVIALVAIGIGVADWRAEHPSDDVPGTSVAPRKPWPRPSDETPPPPPPPERPEVPEPLVAIPVVADDTKMPADFTLFYTSGPSMIGASYDLQLVSTGEATLTTYDREGQIAKLAPDVMQSIWHLVSFHRLLDAKSDLTDDHPGMTEHFPTTLTVSANHRSTKITCLDRCPEGMWDVIQAMTNRTNARQWAHGRRGDTLPRKSNRNRRKDLNTLLDTR